MRIQFLYAPAPIVREFCHRGFEVLSSNASKDFESHDELPGHWAPRQQTVNISGVKKLSWQAIRRVSELVRVFQPDILHAFIPDALSWALFATLGMRRPPKVISFRGITRKPNRLDPADWLTYLSPRVAMHACESQAVMEAMVAGGVPRHRCRTTYNTMWHHEPVASREQWRAQWNVSNNSFLIGSVGTLRPVKGIDTLLDALVQLNTPLDWRVCLGGEILDPKIRERMARPELQHRIVAPGTLRPAACAMRSFDLFVMPSRAEGLCRALIEASTLGVCPIVSDAGGMKELIRHEVDGLVVPKEDPARLASAIERLMHDPSLRAQFGTSASEHVRRLCSPPAVVDRLIELYQKALGANMP
jgi:glycosyltransferase involved in cell wall biosynthesis